MQQTVEHFSAATAMYRQMGMMGSLEQLERDIRALGEGAE